MANVGNISVKLGMDSEEFRQAMNSVGADTSKFVNRLEGLGGSVFDGVESGVKGKRGRLTNTLNQIAFGAEDFMSQLGTGGVSAAIRATSNNASQIAAAFGPIPLLLTVVGTTLASVIVPKMMEWLSSTTDVAKKLEEIDQRQKNALQRTEDIFRAEQRYANLKGKDQQEAERRRLEEEIRLRETQLQQVAQLRAQLKAIEQERKDAEKEAVLNAVSDSAAYGMGGGPIVGETDRSRAAKAAYNEAFPGGSAAQRFDQLNKESEKLRKQLEAAYLQLQVFDRVVGQANFGVNPNISPITSDIFGSTQAFSAINRAISNSTSKTDEKIEENTERTANAVEQMNNRDKDTTSDAAAAAAIGIAEIERF